VAPELEVVPGKGGVMAVGNIGTCSEGEIKVIEEFNATEASPIRPEAT
jgi:hypothetical protein